MIDQPPNEILSKSDTSSYIILEHASNGDIFDYLVNSESPLGEPIAHFYALQLLKALAHLHMKAIAHRDIKPENILLDSQFNFKIADFDLASRYQDGSGVGVFYDQVGTPTYWSPEIHEGKPYKGCHNDLFATGIVIFIMVTGHKPFLNFASKDDPIYQFMTKGDTEGYWNKWSA